MTPHGFTEDQLVGRPALEVLEKLGWSIASAAEEVFGTGGTLGRETPGGTFLLPRLEAALRALNPALPSKAITGAVDALTRDRSAMSLVAANREVWEVLRDGVAVMVHDEAHGGQRTERVRVVNWEEPEANDFLAVSQMTVTGSLYTEGLPRAYTPDLFEQKVSVLFEHVYESYQGEGRSVYDRVA